MPSSIAPQTTIKRWSHLVAPGRLKRWRTKIRKVDQKEAAEILGIHYTKYSTFEARSARPSLDVAYHIESVTDGYVKTTQWAQAFHLDERRQRAA